MVSTGAGTFSPHRLHTTRKSHIRGWGRSHMEFYVCEQKAKIFTGTQFAVVPRMLGTDGAKRSDRSSRNHRIWCHSAARDGAGSLSAVLPLAPYPRWRFFPGSGLNSPKVRVANQNESLQQLFVSAAYIYRVSTELNLTGFDKLPIVS